MRILHGFYSVSPSVAVCRKVWCSVKKVLFRGASTTNAQQGINYEKRAAVSLPKLLHIKNIIKLMFTNRDYSRNFLIDACKIVDLTDTRFCFWGASTTNIQQGINYEKRATVSLPKLQHSQYKIKSYVYKCSIWQKLSERYTAYGIVDLADSRFCKLWGSYMDFTHSFFL